MRPCQQLQGALQVSTAYLRLEDYGEMIAHSLCCKANMGQYKGMSI